MIPEFTQAEKDLLKGKVSAIARKYGCSHTYINLMLNGEIELKTNKSKKIHQGVRETIEFFQPVAQ
ncbi:hypothetical protein [Allomuricauda sp. M10]|uniref:hypothetical protein n=1 Tax=Allomuricauda sp. M10 TaxID=2683292 RepID=UPI001D182141|nr:hypothetical protein [Muricauda sp. M10]